MTTMAKPVSAVIEPKPIQPKRTLDWGVGQNFECIEVPPDWCHSSAIGDFRRQCAGLIGRFDDRITDANFGRLGTVFVPKQWFVVRSLGITSGEISVQYEERLCAVQDMKSIYLGVYGLVLVALTRAERLQVGKRIYAISQPEQLFGGWPGLVPYLQVSMGRTSEGRMVKGVDFGLCSSEDCSWQTRRDEVATFCTS